MIKIKTYCKTIDITDWAQIYPFVYQWSVAKKKPRNRRRAKKFIEEWGGLENIAKEVARQIKEEKLELEPIHYFSREDPSSGKVRRLGSECQMQQVMNCVAVGALRPLFDAKIGPHQYASIEGRGQLKGAKAIQDIALRHPEDIVYYDKMDVQRCFENIKHEVVIRMLKRDISKNKTLIWFVGALISTYDKGLSIGSYLSQWLANYVLSKAYHYASENLFKVRRGKRKKLIKRQVFYMDDIFVSGSDKRDVKLGSKLLVKFIEKYCELNIKVNHNVRPFAAEPIDMMGFVIHANGKMTIRARTFIRGRRAFTRPLKGLKTAQRRVSYWGYFKYANVECVITKHDIRKGFAEAKKMISKEAKRNATKNAECAKTGSNRNIIAA